MYKLVTVLVPTDQVNEERVRALGKDALLVAHVLHLFARDHDALVHALERVVAIWHELICLKLLWFRLERSASAICTVALALIFGSRWLGT